MLVRIGTRESPMALAQARHVERLLKNADPALSVEIIGMQTSADAWHGDLSLLGGKANFTKEIDAALLDGRVDTAVHCMKDVPGDVPLSEGMRFGAFLLRDDVRDVAVSSGDRPLRDMPAGARIGTSSVRRRAQLLRIRSDLAVLPIRGNVNTRLAKLDSGEYDALILARAGLKRLGLDTRISTVLAVDPSTVGAADLPMIPAVGAGVLGIQARTNDTELLSLLATINHSETEQCITAERSMLQELSGHCNSPIAGYARLAAEDELVLNGAVFAPDGSQWVSTRIHGAVDSPEKVGASAASDLLSQGAAQLIAASRP